MLLSVAWNTDGTQLAGAGGNGMVIFGQLLDRWIQFFKCGSLIPSLWNLLLQSELVKYNPDLLLMTGGNIGRTQSHLYSGIHNFLFLILAPMLNYDGCFMNALRHLLLKCGIGITIRIVYRCGFMFCFWKF
jgi:hypothetical protein